MLSMIYSEERGSWEVVDEATFEWVFEGTYEQCEKMVNECNAIALEEGDII